MWYVIKLNRHRENLHDPYVCLHVLCPLTYIITWPGHTPASPSVPSGPLQSVRAGTGSLDTAVVLSPQTAGDTPPCWTPAGDQSFFFKLTSTFDKHWQEKSWCMSKVSSQKHNIGQKVFTHILPHINLAENCLFSVNEDLNIYVGRSSVSVSLPELHWQVFLAACPRESQDP